MRIGGTVLRAGAVAAGLAAAMPAVAQDRPGPFTFRLDLRAEVADNRSLAAVSPGTTTSGEARLGFGFRRETGIETLTLDASAVVRAISGPGAASVPGGFQDQRLRATYARTAARSSLNLSASYSQADIATLRDLTEFVDPDTGEIVLPPDFEGLTGTGIRRVTSASGRLRLGEGTPLTTTLSAGISDTRYENASPALVDALRTNAGASARLQLTPVLAATAGVRWTRFDPAVGAARETTGVDVALSQEFPRGTATLAFAADMLPEGTRLGVTLGRTFDLPAGSLALSVGATQPAGSSTIGLTGALRYTQDLAGGGSLSATASRSVGAGVDDTQRIVTLLALAYGQDVGPNGRLGLNASHAISSVVTTGTETTTTTLGASYSHALTADWTMTVGVNHRIRTATGAAEAQGSTIFLSLGRLWP